MGDGVLLRVAWGMCIPRKHGACMCCAWRVVAAWPPGPTTAPFSTPCPVPSSSLPHLLCFSLASPLIVLTHAALQDPHPKVRWAVMHSVGLYCRHHGPVFQGTCMEAVVGLFVNSLADPSRRVRARESLCVGWGVGMGGEGTVQ